MLGSFLGDGSYMTPKQLSEIGLKSTSIDVIDKNTGDSIGSRTEKKPSFWTTVFSWSKGTKKEDLYTVNTFTFKDEKSASKFENKLRAAEDRAKGYDHNRGQKFDIRRDDKKTVTIIWGQE